MTIKSNNYIIQKIKKYYPDHEIKSEESSYEQPFEWNYKSDFVWIIDPCDGTVNFISGIPIFSISIALAYKSEVVLGVVFDPIRDEIFSAQKTKGAYLNKELISIKKNTVLRDATFGIDISYNNKLLDQELEILRILAPKVRVVRSFFSGALELCYTAIRRIDIRIDDSFKPWDVAAGTLIAKESGVYVSDLQYRPWTIHSKSLLAVAPELRVEVMNLLEGVERNQV